MKCVACGSRKALRGDLCENLCFWIVPRMMAFNPRRNRFKVTALGTRSRVQELIPVLLAGKLYHGKVLVPWMALHGVSLAEYHRVPGTLF